MSDVEHEESSRKACCARDGSLDEDGETRMLRDEPRAE
eukprot:CAMPEP_0185760262 /NCGR_PEP_ID=MMETSP1174-20130828/19123_1 /TAXON_ID=35687 /ORGANISM="Dictyocha speculum, Strain CCMP1381" /LENGTH=37 /DNA_ID= /DNA_START= /DNA_END= /DNA_ORIENTATION=